MKRIFFIGVSAFFMVACGSHSNSADQELPKLIEYYFNQQIGGTPEAGINETYYFRLEDDKVILEQLKVGEEQLELSTADGLLFTATSDLKSAQATNPAKYRKVELFGRSRDGDSQMHWQMDSVPMREQIFMPLAQPQGD